MTWETSDRRLFLPPDWKHRRRYVFLRDQGLCRLHYEGCTLRATEVDHVVAGNDHSLSNLRAVCSSCHKVKTAADSRHIRAHARSVWALMSPDDPDYPHPPKKVRTPK